jgi:hypothetical protein
MEATQSWRWGLEPGDQSKVCLQSPGAGRGCKDLPGAFEKARQLAHTFTPDFCLQSRSNFCQLKPSLWVWWR